MTRTRRPASRPARLTERFAKVNGVATGYDKKTMAVDIHDLERLRR